MNYPQPGGGFAWVQSNWGVVLQCGPLLEFAPHCFTTRDLLLTEDAPEWAQVAGFIGVSPERLRLIRQVHRADVSIVRAGEPVPDSRPEADVIVSDDPTSAIGVRVADCTPILLADRRHAVVGAAHAGWRGTVHRAAIAAVEAMTREFGSTPADLVAAIGPCLGACCGEVGEDVVEAFEAAGHRDLGRWFTDGATSKPHLDLSRANVDQLIDAGIEAANIHVAGLCTKTHAALLHSYRAEAGNAGRMVGLIRATAGTYARGREARTTA